MKFISHILIAVVLSSCARTKFVSVNEIAESYVKLVLSIGQYDSDFVDAYYGPNDWKPAGQVSNTLPSNEFISRSNQLLDQCKSIDVSQFTIEERNRLEMLQKQLIAVRTKVEMMSGKKYSFDEEAKLLYDAVPPVNSKAYFDTLLQQLEEAVPGEDSLAIRYKDFVNQFVIPKELLDTVFQTAISEARKRTNQNYDLPDSENFILEYVNDKSWSGYNYYQGNSQSLIQINTDFPIFIERAIDLACHEGYPGHHVFNALLEKKLVNEKGWVEYSVYPLFSPQSLIAEGSANYGIDVAFPGAERLNFEKEILFPLAQLDSSLADQYYEVLGLVGQLNYAGNEAARNYLNGDMSREEAAAWIEKYLLYAPDRALQRTRFIDQYRSYVINYNLGKDLVASYIERQGGTDDNPVKRWEIFEELLSNPNSASTLE